MGNERKRKKIQCRQRTSEGRQAGREGGEVQRFLQPFFFRTDLGILESFSELFALLVGHAIFVVLVVGQKLVEHGVALHLSHPTGNAHNKISHAFFFFIEGSGFRFKI